MTQTIADRYTVTGRIGAGGGGTVWQATDETLGRTVAVKEVELPANLPQEERDRVRTRALREARAAARLEHRSVVSIYDVLEGQDALHIVMEHVDAPSLATLVSQHGPLPPQRVAAIGLDVLDALAAAHGAGVVHRDVKPSNVLVRDAEHAVVTDFGVAAVLGESGITRTGRALGTPDYIAPEQLEDGPVGPACDLWSLGATLYDAVEGVPPFRRQRTMATIHAVATAEPRPPERAGPLGDVLLQLLTKDPAERPDVAGARELLRTAREATTGQPDTTRAMAATTRPIDAPPDTVGASSGAPTDEVDRGAVAPTDVVDEGGPAEPTHAAGASAHGTGGSSPTDVDRSSERRRAALVLGGLLAAVAAVAGVVALNADGGGDTTADQAGEAQAPSDAAEPGQDEAAQDQGAQPAAEPDSTSPPEQDAASPEEQATPSQEQPAALPEGWELHEDDRYAVGVPSGWEPRDAPGSAVDLVAPSGEVYLRVGDTDDPATDVVADTERIRDSFRSRYPSYEQIGLEPVEYRGHDAVRWEYTYTPGDQTLRAVHLNFSTGDRGYALNYQAPAAQWDELAGRFDDVTATFRER